MTEIAWLTEAKKMLGVRERPGRQNNEAIVELYAEAGHAWVKDDSVAWCAAFVGAMLRRAGQASSGSLAARSYLNWGKKLDKPHMGCIVVFRRGNSSWQGHVGFYVGETDQFVKVLGGNQSNMVRIANYPKTKLLGYRWPASLPVQLPHDPVIEEPQAEVTASLLNFRASPDRGAKIIDTLSKGTKVSVLDTWTRVEVDGKEGWVHNDYLKEI